MSTDYTKPVNWQDIPDNTAAIPRVVATVLVKDVDTAPSKKGAPMVKFTMEILSPDSVESAGTKVGLAGREFNVWLVFTPANRRAYEAANKIISAQVPDGLPPEVIPSDIPELIKHVAKGKVFAGVTLDNEQQFEEDAAGAKKRGPDGQYIVKRNNIAVKTWVAAVTPESLGMQLAR